MAGDSGAGVITKLLICPYFGVYPPWMEHWFANTERMSNHGYEFLFDEDEEAFADRVREVLGIEPPAMFGSGNIWDFRPALGLLYEKEAEGYDFWGHTDFDCVYGQVEKWMTDRLLSEVDIFSNHADYIMGAWSLYRNDTDVNRLFMRDPIWTSKMESDTPTGWAEAEFTDAINASNMVVRYASYQTRNWEDFDGLKLHPDGRLTEGDREVMMAHFRRTKQYPEGCKL